MEFPVSTYTYQHSEVTTLYNPRRKTVLNRTSADKPEKHKLTGQKKKTDQKTIKQYNTVGTE